MKPNHIHPAVVVFALLGAMIACVLPSQTVQPAPPPNPITIETAVAGTVEAAAQQTQQANPVPATATIGSTDTPTSTPKISASGTSLTVREDQSTLFADHKAGIQLIIPAGWMAVRVNEEEYLRAFSSEVVLQNPDILERLTIMRDVNTDNFRLDAYDLHPGHISNGILTLISIVFEPGDIRSLKEWEEAERNGPRPYAGHKFLSANYPQTSNGTQVLVIEESYLADDEGGTVYYRGVFFVLPSGTYVLDFYTNFDYKDARLPEFDQVINSVTPLNP